MSLLQHYCNLEASVPDFLLSPPALHNFTFSIKSLHVAAVLFSKVARSEAGEPDSIRGPPGIPLYHSLPNTSGRWRWSKQFYHS